MHVVAIVSIAQTDQPPVTATGWNVVLSTGTPSALQKIECNGKLNKWISSIWQVKLESSVDKFDKFREINSVPWNGRSAASRRSCTRQLEPAVVGPSPVTKQSVTVTPEGAVTVAVTATVSVKPSVAVTVAVILALSVAVSASVILTVHVALIPSVAEHCV